LDFIEVSFVRVGAAQPRRPADSLGFGEDLEAFDAALPSDPGLLIATERNLLSMNMRDSCVTFDCLSPLSEFLDRV
jgi:hypothetical protein